MGTVLRYGADDAWGNQVKGRCPACNLNGTLFVGSGGWITCGYIPCPNPTAIADMQEHGFPALEKAVAARSDDNPTDDTEDE